MDKAYGPHMAAWFCMRMAYFRAMAISPVKARWGGDGGLGGKGTPSRAGGGVPLPPKQVMRSVNREPYRHRQQSEGFPFPPKNG